MKQILLLIMLAGCLTVEQKLARIYKAPAPIVCIKNTPKYDKVFACRDGAKKFWICSTDGGCMPVDYPQSVFTGQMAEVAP